jgi:UDP-glucose 4-epimerase
VLTSDSTKRILVIGASGLIGREISSKFLSQGCELLRIGKSSKYNDVSVNLHDSNSIRDIFLAYRPTHVINTAWITDPLKYKESPLNENFMMSSISLAMLCLEYKVTSYVGIGTSAEYGSLNVPLNSEIHSGRPTNSYGFYKLATYERLHQLLSRSSTRFLWLRIFQAYGPGENEVRLIPSLFTTLSKGDCFTLQNPNSVLDWITTRDISSALSYCLERDLEGCVDVGTSHGTSVLTLATLVRDLIGKGEIAISDHVKTSSAEFRVVAPDSRLFKSGWIPRDHLSDGLAWVLSLKKT